MILIDGKEFERRLRALSRIRAFGIGLRKSLREQYRAGLVPFPPPDDIRSDFEYWDAKRREFEEREGRHAEESNPDLKHGEAS